VRGSWLGIEDIHEGDEITISSKEPCGVVVIPEYEKDH